MLNSIRRGLMSGALLAICVAASAATGQTPVVVESPPGWFGVTLSDEGLFDERGAAFFDSYPVVSNVEPGSPAARAGVVPGDVLMSFNSHDMRGSVFQLRNWLKPGAPFVLQLRRNDGVRVVRGTLGRAPDGWDSKILISIRPTPTEAFEFRTQTPSRPPVTPSPQRVVMRPPLPSPVPSALIPAFTFGAGVFPFAGMEFTALNEDIRDLLGVKPEGVFVTNVVEGTPARIAGLKGGDVLLLANGVKLESPVDLVQAIAEAQDRKTLTLRIVRKRKPQNLTLRW
jgi:S1-C subfamily serine protease